MKRPDPRSPLKVLVLVVSPRARMSEDVLTNMIDPRLEGFGAVGEVVVPQPLELLPAASNEKRRIYFTGRKPVLPPAVERASVVVAWNDFAVADFEYPFQRFAPQLVREHRAFGKNASNPGIRNAFFVEDPVDHGESFWGEVVSDEPRVLTQVLQWPPHRHVLDHAGGKDPVETHVPVEFLKDHWLDSNQKTATTSASPGAMLLGIGDSETACAVLSSGYLE